MSTKEREIVAYHESGHAIVATVLPGHRSGAQDLDRAARLRRARLHDAAAARGSLSDDSAAICSASSRCCSAAAPPRRSRSARSRPARRTTCSAPPTSRARWSPSAGMSDALGAINYDGNKRGAFLDIPMPQERGLYGEETAQLIDAEVKRIMTDAHDKARQHPHRAPRQARDRDAPAARGRGDGRRRAARAARRPAAPDGARDRAVAADGMTESVHLANRTRVRTANAGSNARSNRNSAISSRSSPNSSVEPTPQSPVSGSTTSCVAGAAVHCVNAMTTPAACTATTSPTHAGQPPRFQRRRRQRRADAAARVVERRIQADREPAIVASSPRRCSCWPSPAR